jgi:hypothetical protein
MKKQAMSLAVTAALLGGAVSTLAQPQPGMSINEGGLGETLIYPFYSAANGNDTYVHIVNTTSLTKAVKVRFIESQNSDEVLDFNLYLSPQDEWAAVVTGTPDGGALVRTVDNSCTVPAIPEVDVLADGTIIRAKEFVNFEYLDDTFDNSIERTSEGYIEMIEMGQWDPTSAVGAAAVHGADGVPANCAALVSAWTAPIIGLPDLQGAWLANPAYDQLTTWDGGGLYGYGVLINVDNGTAFGMDATAVVNFADLSQGPLPNLHTEPGNIEPGLNDAQLNVTVFNAIDSTTETYAMTTGTDAVSALFMTDVIINDYVVDPDINAATDWIINFPTKKDYTQGPSPISPFSSVWGPNAAEDGGIACEPVSLFFWDREEAFEDTPSEGPIFSPAPDVIPGEDLEICKEVNVISFGSTSAVQASSRIDYGVSGFLDYTEGWALLDLTGAQLVTPLPVTSPRELDTADGNVFTGLPATGFAVFEYVNGQIIDPVDGIVKANYEAAVEHKTVTTVFTD